MYTTQVYFSFLGSISGSSSLCGSTSATVTCMSETLTTNIIIENATPITIAIVRSNTTVAIIVIRNCRMAVLIFLPKMDFIEVQSFILQAVTIRTPASAESGIIDITPPSTNIESSSIAE